MNLALDAAAPQGRIAICGEQAAAVIKPSDQFIRKELMAFGSWYFRPNDPLELFELYRHGFTVEKMISHRFSLEEADAAHRQFASGESGKVVLVQT